MSVGTIKKGNGNDGALVSEEVGVAGRPEVEHDGEKVGSCVETCMMLGLLGEGADVGFVKRTIGTGGIGMKVLGAGVKDGFKVVGSKVERVGGEDIGNTDREVDGFGGPPLFGFEV